VLQPLAETPRSRIGHRAEPGHTAPGVEPLLDLLDYVLLLAVNPG
jgi:hypothetical protein